MELKYGMLVTMEATPKGKFKYSQPTIYEVTEFEVARYWEDDTDPNSYKVKLIPTDERFYEEKMYSSDLKQMISNGTVKVIG